MKPNNANATIDKIEYMMNRLGGDDEVTADDLESMIIKVFVASFDYEHGFESDLIRALLAARHVLRQHADDDENEPELLDRKDVEAWYLQCQQDMYVQAGYSKDYAAESASWPDALPLDGDWDKNFLRAMARKETAHHLVTIDQIREEMRKAEKTA